MIKLLNKFKYIGLRHNRSWALALLAAQGHSHKSFDCLKQTWKWCNVFHVYLYAFFCTKNFFSLFTEGWTGFSPEKKENDLIITRRLSRTQLARSPVDRRLIRQTSQSQMFSDIKYLEFTWELIVKDFFGYKLVSLKVQKNLSIFLPTVNGRCDWMRGSVATYNIRTKKKYRFKVLKRMWWIAFR